MNIHPKFTTRFESLGRNYEVMNKNTHEMNSEILTFSKTSEINTKKFMAANNQMAELEKMPGISRKALDERWAVLDSAAAKVKEYIPHFSELIYNTRPLFDGIFKLADGIYKGYAKLQAAKNDEAESERLMHAMESRFALLQEDYKVIRHRIDTCKSKMDEILALHNSLLN